MANTNQGYIARHYLKNLQKFNRVRRVREKKGWGKGEKKRWKKMREEARKDEIRLTYTVKTVVIVEKSVRRASPGRCCFTF